MCRRPLLLLLALLIGQALIVAFSFATTDGYTGALSRSLLIIGVAGFALSVWIKLADLFAFDPSTAAGPERKPLAPMGAPGHAQNGGRRTGGRASQQGEENGQRKDQEQGVDAAKEPS